MSAAAILPVVAVWLGIRALSGLYPGYGIDSVEELRRHTYSVFATLAILAIFALGSQVGGSLSRLLLGLFFLGLLVLVPMIVRIASVQIAPERIDEILADIGRLSALYTSSQRDSGTTKCSLTGRAAR